MTEDEVLARAKEIAREHDIKLLDAVIYTLIAFDDCPFNSDDVAHMRELDYDQLMRIARHFGDRPRCQPIARRALPRDVH